METSHFSLYLSKKDVGIEWQYIVNEIKQDGFINLGSLGEYISSSEIKSLQSLIIENNTSSLFFPTFRRIEGGYSIINIETVRRIKTKGNNTYPYPLSNLIPVPISPPLPILPTMGRSQSQRSIDHINISIKDEFNNLSNRISIAAHRFICSISTHDLGSLLRLHHAGVTEKIDEYSRALNKSLINELENIKSGIKDSKDESLSIVSKLQREVADVDNKRDELLQPFKVLSELVTKVMHYKGVKLDDFTIGQSDDAIDSRLLSAGEQQMLSFLCYNAFYEDSVIFIDEPELSLHPDWQRRLFPNLMKQQSSNQFIVATHSPLIYSKYEDKEIILSEEKGG